MMRADEAALGADTNALASALQAEGLPVSAHYIGQPVYEYPIFAAHSAFPRGEHPYRSRAYGAGQCPGAEEILRTCLILSVNEAYSLQDLDETALGIRRAVEWFVGHRA
jgi:dTDP-4-amino-4,6-dideoxygalactose transaminase